MILLLLGYEWGGHERWRSYGSQENCILIFIHYFLVLKFVLQEICVQIRFFLSFFEKVQISYMQFCLLPFGGGSLIFFLLTNKWFYYKVIIYLIFLYKNIFSFYLTYNFYNTKFFNCLLIFLFLLEHLSKLFIWCVYFLIM